MANWAFCDLRRFPPRVQVKTLPLDNDREHWCGSKSLGSGSPALQATSESNRHDLSGNWRRHAWQAHVSIQFAPRRDVHLRMPPRALVRMLGVHRCHTALPLFQHFVVAPLVSTISPL